MEYPQRKQGRLQGFDYGSAGVYFITVCVQDRKPVLSEIVADSVMKAFSSTGECCIPMTEPQQEGPVCPQDGLVTGKTGLSDSVGAVIDRPFPRLTATGKIVEEAIRAIPSHYQDVNVDHYVIMPNHVHLLLSVGMAKQTIKDGTSIPRVIQQLKGYVTKRYGSPLWQKSYYDHIIRNEVDYQIRWNYIDENPLRWRDDELYAEK